MVLNFQNENFTVSHDSTIIQLLKKEFELLNFLYNHAGQSFTREQLLDAVWPMQSPVDRTVDDHIYRLRKKTKKLENYFVIKTVKGYGYRLEIPDYQETVSPLENDEEFRELTNNLLSKYHRYGQGNAVKTMLQSKTLGIQAHRENLFISLLIDGDWKMLLETEDIQFSEKALFLLHLDLLIGNDRNQTVRYYEKAMDKDLFSISTKQEAAVLSPIVIYLFAKEYDKAADSLIQANQQILSPNHGFFPFLQLSWLMYHIGQKEPREVETSIKSIESLFKKFNYQREVSLFTALKGIWELEKGNKVQGRKTIQEGIQMARDIGFESHFLFLIATCLFFFENHVEDAIAYEQLKKEWDLLDEKYNFDYINKEVNRKLNRYIFS